MIKGFFGKYRWLSNFWPSPIEMWGKHYPTVEHYYQARKCLHEDEHEEIRKACSPAKAKRLGGLVTEMRPYFMKDRLMIMKGGVEAKFEQNPDLAKLLMATGDQILEEANTWGDTFWGTVDGKGQNHLGMQLMDVRQGLRWNRIMAGDYSWP